MYNKFKNIKREFAVWSLAITLMAGFGACSDDDDSSNGVNIQIEGNKLMENKPDREKMLRNPLNGWVIYTGLGDGLSDTFWNDYDNFQSSEGLIKVSDYGTTIFIRGAWSDFNPEEGKYVWDEDVNTKPAQRYKSLVNGAKERNLKIAFSFVVDSRDKHYEFTPQYVKNAPGIEGFITRTGVSTDVWSPYPDNKVFQEYYEKFVMALAEKYDDPDVVEFISGTGIGKWGESHTVWYSTGNNEPKEAVFEWVTDVYSRAFKKVPLIINYHRWIFSRQTWDGSNYDANSENMIKSAISKGYSIRHDAFGMKTYYSSWERNFAKQFKFKRPIIAEGGWVRSSHGSSINGDGYTSYADVRKGEFDEAKGAHANMMDFRYSSSGTGETWSWFNEAFHLVKQFIREGGYRLYPSVLSLPETIQNGKTLEIGHRWNNLGWGYCPTNIPQWEGKYKIAFALLDKTTLTPKYVFVDQAPELADCVKGTPQNYVFKHNVSNVSAGNYRWAVGIVDTTKDNEIGIQISAKGDVTEEGWLQIFDVTVQ